MQKIHSLQFQLPAVVVGVFIGTLFFLVLLFREIGTIMSKTEQVAVSAQVSDLVANWTSELSNCARERTKFASLGHKNYLESFQGSLDAVSMIYREIRTCGPDASFKSTVELMELYQTHMEYASLVSRIAERKRPRVDAASNEAFKNYETMLRDGLFQVQQTMRSERVAKMESLKESLDRAENKVIYTLILLLIMIGYVAIILKSKILTPLKALEAGANQVGTGNLGFQTFVNCQNEIGNLADAFNRMSLQLKENQVAEVRLKRLEAIDQIVRSVNHEINNPLMIISGNAEYLSVVQENLEPSLKAKLHTIIEEVKRISVVTQRLKEIREPVTENYISEKDQMIDLLRSSQIIKKDWELRP